MILRPDVVIDYGWDCQCAKRSGYMQFALQSYNVGKFCPCCRTKSTTPRGFATVFTDQSGSKVSQYEACESWGRQQQAQFLFDYAAAWITC